MYRDMIQAMERRDELLSALCIAEVCSSHGAPAESAAQAWRRIGQRFEFAELLEGLRSMPVNGHWEQLERDALLDELLEMRVGLTASVIQADDEKNWYRQRQAPVMDWGRIVAQYRAGDPHSFAFATLTVRKLANLLREGL